MSEYIIVMILVCFNDDEIKTNIKHFALILFFCSYFILQAYIYEYALFLFHL